MKRKSSLIKLLLRKSNIFLYTSHCHTFIHKRLIRSLFLTKLSLAFINRFSIQLRHLVSKHINRCFITIKRRISKIQSNISHYSLIITLIKHHKIILPQIKFTKPSSKINSKQFTSYPHTTVLILVEYTCNCESFNTNPLWSDKSLLMLRRS